MIYIWRSAVLASLLCLSPTGAFAQTEAERMAKVITLGDPQAEALARHRLTGDSLRRMFAADRELDKLWLEVPDIARRATELASRIDPERRLGDIELNARVHEGIPEMARILRAHKISGREYSLTYIVAMVTAMADDTFTDEALRREGMTEIPAATMTPALRFWRSMDPALKAEAAEWKKMRGYDKGLTR